MQTNKKRKLVIKFFFVWSEHKEAQWLRKMSLQGWHLVKASLFNYTFEKGEPRDFNYQFDFAINTRAKEEEYLELFHTAGWELINRFGSWYYFRKPADEHGQEIYTDASSLKQKYRRVLMILLATGLPLLLNLRLFSRSTAGSFYQYFMVFNLCLFVLWVYAFVRIILYMRKL